MLLLMSLASLIGINKTNKLYHDDFYPIGPESAPLHLESMTFARTKVRQFIEKTRDESVGGILTLILPFIDRLRCTSSARHRLILQGKDE